MGLTFDGVNGISATGNIISSQGFISATGNIYAGNLITALSTTGNISGANILASGTMSSTGAATHASLTLGTPLTIANGGTSGLTANNVLLGNGTGAPQVVAPGTAGNVLASNGTTWVSTAQTPLVITQQAYSPNTTYSISVNATNRPIMLCLHYSGVCGARTTIGVSFQWGLGSLTDTFNAYPATGVDFVVDPAPSMSAFLIPTSNTTLQFRVNTFNIGNQTFWVSAIQL
jgi:hypothetical protein